MRDVPTFVSDGDVVYSKLKNDELCCRPKRSRRVLTVFAHDEENMKSK